MAAFSLRISFRMLDTNVYIVNIGVCMCVCVVCVCVRDSHDRRDLYLNITFATRT